MMKKLVLTVGNSMMGDDGAGSLLAKMIEESPLEDWSYMHGGSAPENVIHQVRAIAPDRVLIVDAADFDLSPGKIRLIPEDRLDNPFLFSTHTMPLTFLIQAMREFVPRVELIGIQPELVAFGAPMSASVREAVREVYDKLKMGDDYWEKLETTAEDQVNKSNIN